MVMVMVYMHDKITSHMICLNNLGLIQEKIEEETINTLLQSLPKHITIRWRSVCEESEIL